MLETIPVVGGLGGAFAGGEGRLIASGGKVHRSEIIFMLTHLLCSFLNPLLTMRDAIPPVHEVVISAVNTTLTRRLLILYLGSFRLLSDELR